MPATTSDIIAGSRRAEVVRFEDAAVLADFPTARDGLANPAEGFCDSASDAQAIINARGALLGRYRRFALETEGLQWTLDPALGTPTIRVTDSDQGLSASDFIVSRVEFDLENERTVVELF